MGKKGWIAGLSLGALCAAGVAVAPAIGAQNPMRTASYVESAYPRDSQLGAFTPASADPKLAAALARSGIDPSGFRFTPADSQPVAKRSVTVAVRARTERGSPTPAAEHAQATDDTLTLAPIAYNLGVSVGWKRFAVTGDVAELDTPAQPGSSRRSEVGVNYTGKKFTGHLSAASEKPLADQPPALRDDPSYSLNLGGSYSISHNIDLTAGVRYKSERNRLRIASDEDRRDSQAVYIGTAFRF